MKNSGLFLNMAKWCLLGLFFQVFMLLWFVLGVSGIVPKVLKMLVFFPVLGGFCGVAYSCLFGFGRFRCFCVSCVCFPFLCCFCFCFVCFVLFCCWIVLGVGSCFVFWLFFFVFWGLFLFFIFVLKVRCGGPKGHLTWP